MFAKFGIGCLLALVLQNGHPTVASSYPQKAASPKLTPHRISLANGKTFSLNLPENYQIRVAAQGGVA
ncbi:hypothetical protein ACKFKF_19950 [Phormidesmis sp. 146-12]